MSITIDEIFNKKKQQITDYYTNWKQLCENVTSLLNDTTSKDYININTKDLELIKGIEHFKNELDNPLITLATSGTTSSGKSSLVNLLCGGEIMPVGVLETSAGVVTINHHPTNKILTIFMEELPAKYSNSWSDLSGEQITQKLKDTIERYHNLRKENSGPQPDLSDKQITQKLKDVMTCCLDLHAEQCEPLPPRFELEYPTRLGMQPEIAGLPKGFKLRILDLPGLKYVADVHNKEIIRKEIKPALCLVTYNGEEADPEKQQVLLNEVVENVKELQGSLPRMLFILNKIDVFRRDPDFEIETQKFINKTTQNIRNSIVKALPVYSNEIHQLQTHPLSTYPALCAYQALNSSQNTTIEVLGRIMSHFNYLISEDIRDNLLINVTKWSSSQQQQVAENVWQTSYGASFDATLCKHVQNNIPDIILPHLIGPLWDTADLALKEINQINYEYVNATKDRYEKERENLEKIERSLEDLRAKFQADLSSILSPLFNYKSDHLPQYDQIMAKLTEVSTDLENFYKIPKGKLSPLHTWGNEIGKTIDSFLEIIDENIKQPSVAFPKSPLLESLPPEYRKELYQTLESLRISGYHQYAAKGTVYEATNSVEKEILRNMNQALNDLASVLAKTLQLLLERVAEREKERMETALQFLLEEHVRLFNKKSKEIAPNFSGLEITLSRLKGIEHNLVLKFILYGGFQPVPVERDIKVGSVREKVGEKRLWWTLWILKEDVYQDRDLYEKRSHDVATIPKSEVILQGFGIQARLCRPEGKVIEWLQKQVKEFLSSIQTYQVNLLGEYKQRLEKALQRAEEEKNTNINNWLTIEKAMENLRNELDNFKVLENTIN